MKAADRIESQFGVAMLESLGVRTPPDGAANGPPKVIAAASPDDGRSRSREAAFIEIDRLVPDPKQPRRYFDESIEEMAESLKKHGQLEPIVVHWQKGLGKWMIVCGERRYRGAVRAGLKGLNCSCIERDITEAEIRELQLIENIQREDLKPVELARSYKELAAMNNWTLDQLAASLKKSKATISRTMALLKLPEDVQARVESGELAPSLAYEVLKEATPEAQREKAARIIAEGITRDELTGKGGKPAGGKGRPAGRPEADSAEPGEKAKPAHASKVFKLGNATLTIKWGKATVRRKDIIAALEAALAEVRSDGKDAPVEPAA